jgi:hypothetical protein
VDLGSIAQFETEQLFTVDSSRIEFVATRGGFGRGGAAPTPPAAGHTAFRYYIEVSKDGNGYSKILDKTDNGVTRYTEFDELPPHCAAMSA